MTDNVTTQSSTLATIPASTVVATDDVGGVHYQRIKLVDGTLDSATAIASGNGVAAGALRVTVASDSTGVIAATQSGTWNVGTVTTVTGITNVVHVDDNSGSLTVDNAGTFAVQDGQVVADNAGFTDGATKVFAAGFIFDEVAGTALTENDAAAARIDSKRAQVFAIEDATTRGQRATVSAAGALKVDASATTQPVSGTVAATQSGTWTVQPGNTANTTAWKVDGSAVTQPVSIAATLTVDTEMPAAAALADNTANPTVPGVGAFLMGWDGAGGNWDRVPANSTQGMLVVGGGNTFHVDDNSGSLTVDNAGTFAVQAGQAAQDAAVSGNPVRAGGRARTSELVVSANDDTTDLVTDLAGKLITLPFANPENFESASITITSSTADTQVLASAGAGLRHYITAISCANDSATATLLTIKDSTTVIWRTYVPAGGGSNITLPVPLRGTAATVLNAACGTSVASCYVSVTGYKGA